MFNFRETHTHGAYIMCLYCLKLFATLGTDCWVHVCHHLAGMRGMACCMQADIIYIYVQCCQMLLFVRCYSDVRRGISEQLRICMHAHSETNRTFTQICFTVGPKSLAAVLQLVNVVPFQQAWNIHPMLIQSWSSVYDAGPTLYQHRVNAGLIPALKMTRHGFCCR